MSRVIASIRAALGGFAVVASSPSLRRLELAYATSITAERTFVVAVGVFAYEVGGASAVGVVALVRMIPAAVTTPFASALADRFERERVMTVVAAGSGTVLAAAALCYYEARSSALIFGLAALHAILSMLFRPTMAAVLPSLARTPAELTATNGVSTTVEGFGALVGPLLAGVLVATASPGAAFGVGAAIYGVAVVALARVRIEGRLRRTPRNPGGELAAGFRALAGEPGARLVAGLIWAQTMVRGALNVLAVVVAFRLLGAGGGWAGFLWAAFGAGSLLGGFAALGLVGRRLAVPFGLGVACWSAPFALLALAPHRVPALLLLACVGVGNAFEDVSGRTLVQRLVPDHVLGRVFGIVYGGAMAAEGVGAIATSALVAAIGVRPTLVVVGVYLPVLVLLAFPRLRTIDASAAAPNVTLDLLQRVPMFAPLSVAAKEYVAASLVPVEAAAGSEIIRQGDVGDRFYVLVSGSADVQEDGRTINRCAPGDGFGEIALLRDVPRTATIVAREQSDLLALDRADFLAAVTGHSLSRDAAEDVVEEHLARGGKISPASPV